MSDFDNGLWNFPEEEKKENNQPDGFNGGYGPEYNAPQKSGFSTLVLVIVCVASIILGAFLGGTIIKNELEAKYSDLSARDERYSDLYEMMDFIDENYYQDLTREKLIEYACRGMIDNLDAFSELLTPEDVEYANYVASVSSLYGKIGMTVSFKYAGKFIVTQITKGSPAELYNSTAPDQKKIKIGDCVYKINGYNVEGLQTEDFTDLVSGGIGSTIRLSFYRSDGAGGVVTNDDVQIVRANYTAPTVYEVYDFAEYSPALAPLDALGLAYVKLDGFTGTAAEDFAAAMQRFVSSGKEKLVLDLRDNGGGYGSVLAKVASYLLDNETHDQEQNVIKMNFKNGTSYTYKTAANNYIYNGKTPHKIAVLVNGNTASASEALIGAMLTCSPEGLEGGSCEIFGTTTFGKGIGQTSFTFTTKDNREYSISLTNGWYSFYGDVQSYVPGATEYTDVIQGKGFTPIGSYYDESDYITLVGDKVFEKAVEYLKTH